jgi:hypothetical protein
MNVPNMDMDKNRNLWRGRINQHQQKRVDYEGASNE